MGAAPAAAKLAKRSAEDADTTRAALDPPLASAADRFAKPATPQEVGSCSHATPPTVPPPLADAAAGADSGTKATLHVSCACTAATEAALSCRARSKGPVCKLYHSVSPRPA